MSRKGDFFVLRESKRQRGSEAKGGRSQGFWRLCKIRASYRGGGAEGQTKSEEDAAAGI